MICDWGGKPPGSLRDRRADRRGRDGRGLPGEGPAARARGRDQGPAGVVLATTRTGCGGSSRRRRRPGLLNHPNITAVYDIGSHEGAPYVVSELLEGETLRAALSGGKLSPRKAIDYALQIAHGLAAAHEKGIVHRDLKPENLFVTKDGRIKILDFGLAKLTHAEEGGGQQTNLPTATAGTEPGVVLGTLGYMSPEQVRGRPADVRVRHLLLRRDPLRDALGQARVPGRLAPRTRCRRSCGKIRPISR